MKEKRTHIEIVAPVIEMANAVELSGLVHVDERVLREVTEDDSSPKFVLSDIEECRSGNNVNYDMDAFQLIAEQVNSKLPNGYLGHIKETDRDFAFPLPQVLWLGSTPIKRDGKAHLITKGYLPPESQARGLIKRKMITSVSWAGDAILVPAGEGGYRLKDYILESIDFARKHKEGLKGQSLVLVTEEIKGKLSGGNKVDGEPTYEEIVSRLTPADLRAHNPAVIKTLTEMAKEEVKGETDAAVTAKETELIQKFEKELEKNPDITMMQKIKSALGIDEDSTLKPDEMIVELLSRLEKLGKDAVKDWFTAEILDKKVPEAVRPIVGRLIPVTEMEGDWKSERGLEKIKASLIERADDLIENDKEVQLLTEMSKSRGGPRLTEHQRHESRSRKDDDDNTDTSIDRKAIERRGNLRVETIDIGR